MANTIISNVGNQPNATGMGFQSHIIYATNSGRWWIFYWNSSTTLKAAYSSDGVTWTDSGVTKTLSTFTSTNDGRDLSVFYKNISSTDVVWVVGAGTSGEAGYIRGTISGTTLTWGSDNWEGSALTNKSNIPNGLTLVLDSANKPAIGTTANADFSVERATNADTGASWTNAWGTETSVIGAAITNESHQRLLIPYGASQKLLALSGNGSSATKDSGVEYGYFNGSSWSGDASVGFTAVTADFNDWGACRVSDTDFHVVKRTAASTFTHRRWNGSTTWSAGQTIPSQTSKANAGVAMYSDGTNVFLFCIDSAAGNAVRVCVWTSAGGWGTWSDVENSSATRNNIGVTPAPDGSGNLIVYWTEGSVSPYAIKGALYNTTLFFRSASRLAGASVGTATISKPQGTVQNDVMIATVQLDDQDTYTVTPPAGWAQIGTAHTVGSGAGSCKVYCFYKVAGASEGSSYAFVISNATFAIGNMISIAGADTTTPIDTSVWGAAGSAANVASYSVGSITTQGATEMLVLLAEDYQGTTYTISGLQKADTTASSGQGSFFLFASTAGSYGGYTVSMSPSSYGGSFLIAVQHTAPAGGSSVTGAAALSADGNMSTSAAMAYVAAASLSTNGNLASGSAVDLPAAAALSADGNLSTAAVMAYAAAATLLADGNLTTAAVMQYAAAASLSADGNLATSAVILYVALAALAANGNLTADGTVTGSGSTTGAAALIANAVMTASAVVRYAGAASLSADANLSAAAAMKYAAAIVVQAQANLAASASRGVVGSASFSSDAQMNVAGALHIAAQIALAANANATFLAALTLVGAAALQTTANMTATGIKDVSGWRPPTATILLQATIAAVVALQAQPEGTILLQDSPEGTIE